MGTVMQKMSLGSTIADLLKAKRNWEKFLPKTLIPTVGNILRPQQAKRQSPFKSRLNEVQSFGTNPGNLRMLQYVPKSVRNHPALVVVLHGCMQAADGYDTHSGWSALADKGGFLLLYAEQKSENNQNKCFNWFLPTDIARDAGEALSIHQMVEKMVRSHKVDQRRIFITGLSAGGAMANAMLATYPETFAGGAVIAGLPYGSAHNVMEALTAMKSAPARSADDWGDQVRFASSHTGPWPLVSVWHGAGDRTVSLSNGRAVASQWTDVHGLKETVFRETSVNATTTRRIWNDKGKKAAVELYTISGMGHGTPIDPNGKSGVKSGKAGPFMLDVGLSSTLQMAKTWGLV